MSVKARYRPAYVISMIGLVIMMVTFAGCSGQSVGQASTMVTPQSQEKPLRLLNDSAETVYNYTKSGEYEEARIELERLSNLLTKISFSGITTLDGVNALTQTVVNARRIYNRAQLSEKDALTAATQLRLITDALTHRNHPMWLEYEYILRGDAEKLLAMVKSSNDVGSLAALQKLRNDYGIIQPAVIITKEAPLVEKVDSMFKFLTMELSVGKVDYLRLNQGMDHLPMILDELFGSKDSQTIVPLAIQHHNVIWTTFIASIIISALAYVAWRRYRNFGA